MSAKEPERGTRKRGPSGEKRGSTAEIADLYEDEKLGKGSL